MKRFHNFPLCHSFIHPLTCQSEKKKIIGICYATDIKVPKRCWKLSSASCSKNFQMDERCQILIAFIHVIFMISKQKTKNNNNNKRWHFNEEILEYLPYKYLKCSLLNGICVSFLKITKKWQKKTWDRVYKSFKVILHYWNHNYRSKYNFKKDILLK